MVTPEGWAVEQLRDLAQFGKGFGLPKSALTVSGAESCIHYGELFTKYKSVVRSVEGRCNAFVGAVRSRRGDVLMPGSDVTPRGLATASALPFDDVILGGDVIIVRPNEDRLLGAYLASWIRHNRDSVLRLAKGSTVYHLHGRDLGNLRLALPPLREQEAIAEALSDADAAIEAVDALIAKKRDMKQAAMQELLTGRTRLPGCEANWSDVNLGSVAMINPQSLGAHTSADFHFRYIALEDVNRGRLVQWTNQVFGTAPSRARRCLQFGDFLFATVRPNLLGHHLFQGTEANWVCSTGFAVVRAEPLSLDARFLAQWFFSTAAQAQIDVLVTGSNYPAVTSRQVGDLILETPPLIEQRAIANFLADMDAEIDALVAQLEKLVLVKLGMMQELLSGRVRLV